VPSRLDFVRFLVGDHEAQLEHGHELLGRPHDERERQAGGA
jgi:hypothetical protein